MVDVEGAVRDERISKIKAELTASNLDRSQLLHLAATAIFAEEQWIDRLQESLDARRELEESLHELLQKTKEVAGSMRTSVDEMSKLSDDRALASLNAGIALERLVAAQRTLRVRRKGGATKAAKEAARFESALQSYRNDPRLLRMSYEAAALELITKQGHHLSHSALKRKLSAAKRAMSKA